VKTLTRLAAFSAAALVSGAAFAATAQDTSTTTTTVVRDARGNTRAVDVTGVTAGQPVPNPAGSAAQSGPGADTGYTGDLQGRAFRDVDQRIAALEARVQGNRRASAALSKIKGEEKYRRARHDGELRDWDRELLNKQLDQLESSLGA
jgi:hypothetical protein